MKPEELYRAVGGADDALLTEFEEQKTPKPWKRWGALAACAALLLGGTLWLHPWSAVGNTVSPTEAVDPPSPATAQPTEAPIAAPTPLDALPELVFTEDGYNMAADIAYPDGYFIRDLTDAQIAAIWGLETPSWEGETADVSGKVIYDGTGTPWVVQLAAVKDGETLYLELSPERLPPQCIAIADGKTCEFYGTAVRAFRSESYATVDFLRGEGETAVGVRLTLEPATDTLTAFATRVVSQSLRPDGTLDVLFLRTEDVPAWRSEALDEAQAYADASFGAYLPQTLPEGYAFSDAWREQGEDRDWLSANWFDGWARQLNVVVSRPEVVTELVRADEPQAYVWDYYGAEKPEVPEEYHATWVEPVFYRSEVTREVLFSRIHATDESGRCAARFGIYYPDGTVVRVYASAERSALETLLTALLPADA